MIISVGYRKNINWQLGLGNRYYRLQRYNIVRNKDFLERLINEDSAFVQEA